MVLFLIRVLITDVSWKGSSNESFTQYNVVIDHLTPTRIAQLGSSVAALTLLVCWLIHLAGYLSHLLYFLNFCVLCNREFYLTANHLVSLSICLCFYFSGLNSMVRSWYHLMWLQLRYFQWNCPSIAHKKLAVSFC